MSLKRGRVAQRESTPFTREGSHVQSMPRPPFVLLGLHQVSRLKKSVSSSCTWPNHASRWRSIARGRADQWVRSPFLCPCRAHAGTHYRGLSFRHHYFPGAFMTAIAKAVASARAKRYRNLAREARFLAARSKGVPRHEFAYLRMAARWEQFALEAEEDEHVFGFLEKAGYAESNASTVELERLEPPER